VGGGITDHGTLTGLNDPDHDAIYCRWSSGAGAPAAGSVASECHFYLDTTPTPDVLYYGKGAGTNFVHAGTLGDAYNQMTGDSGSASATGSETFRFEGTDCIGTVVAAGAPDKVTIKLSCASQAQGDVIYFNGTNWVRLAPGTSGQF
jgi:hypothetical protein